MRVSIGRFSTFTVHLVFLFQSCCTHGVDSHHLHSALYFCTNVLFFYLVVRTPFWLLIFKRCERRSHLREVVRLEILFFSLSLNSSSFWRKYLLDIIDKAVCPIYRVAIYALSSPLRFTYGGGGDWQNQWFLTNLYWALERVNYLAKWFLHE